jgi:hypothetical protein
MTRRTYPILKAAEESSPFLLRIGVGNQCHILHRQSFMPTSEKPSSSSRLCRSGQKGSGQVILPHPLVRRQIAEHVVLLIIRSSHIQVITSSAFAKGVIFQHPVRTRLPGVASARLEFGMMMSVHGFVSVERFRGCRNVCCQWPPLLPLLGHCDEVRNRAPFLH